MTGVTDWVNDLRMRHGFEVATRSLRAPVKVMNITNDTARKARAQFERVVWMLGLRGRVRAQERSRRNQANMHGRRHGRPRGR